MKIAILTAFRKMPESYSLVNDVRDQVKVLVSKGHKVVFFAQQGCEGTGIDCETRAILPHFKTENDVINQEAKEQLIDIFEKELSTFDVVITHDLMYLRGYVTYRSAIMQCGIKVKWLHWAHSGIGEHLDLRMPNAKYIYMNYADAKRFASHIGVNEEDVGVVFNDKDASLFFSWHPITKAISEQVDLIGPDIIQVYPLCSTRMDAKGINEVIRVFAQLKKLGNKVLLLVVNANGHKKQDLIEEKLQLAEQEGLTRQEVIFTSQLNEEWVRGMPRQVVKDLMQMANLFIFPSTAEVCSNVLLEASMTKQLVVLNTDLPCLFDFSENALQFNFGSMYHTAFVNRNAENYAKLAKTISDELKSSRSNQQFLKVKRISSFQHIYNNQFEPLLNGK
jgi:glycosyltransferase involved in cell wall biosynthesis